jgi:hypothetical protein
MRRNIHILSMDKSSILIRNVIKFVFDGGFLLAYLHDGTVQAHNTSNIDVFFTELVEVNDR